MNTYAELLDRAKWARLSQEEINQVARELRSDHPATDRYTLLHILSRAGAVGRDWNTLPSAAHHFDLERAIDPAIISIAKRRLATVVSVPTAG